MDVSKITELYYSKLKALSGISNRPQQKECSDAIAMSVLENNLQVVEAPTGTGKTISYLVGGLAARAFKRIPIVVATGTKALQEQVLTNDIPKLIKAGLIPASEVTIAKGKRNYVCIRNCISYMQDLEEAETDPDKYLPESLSDLELDDLNELIIAFESNKWDGDFDNYSGKLTTKTYGLGVDSNNCSGPKCDHYAQCPYYKKRKELATKSLVITNQNYLLEDLKMAYGAENEEIQGSLLPFEEYMLIVDEGHHLPEKAVEVGKSVANFAKIKTAFLKWNGMHAQLSQCKSLLGAAKSYGYENDPKSRLDVLKHLLELETKLSEIEVPEALGYTRFKKGVIPSDLLSAIVAMEKELNPMVVNLGQLLSVYKKLPEPTADEKEVGSRAGEIKQDLLEFVRCLNRLSTKKDYAKWLSKKSETAPHELHACPLEGAVVLKPLLWDSPRIVGKVIVSATLRDIAGFTRYSKKAGLPPDSKYLVLEPLFDYSKSSLVIPKMEHSPKQSTRKKYIEELKEVLPKHIDKSKNTLILFQSWAMLKEFTPILKNILGTSLKLQGESPVKLLVDAHKKDVDKHKFSVLAGVASLSEGLDLPGKYCEHVMITTLPFATPADPVEEEIAELLGPAYFSTKSMPDAIIKLVQMTGRLIRTESDTGVLTIFDNRLVTEKYGQQMLKRLPNYTKKIY